MAKRNDYTVSVVQPLTASRVSILLKLLAEQTAKREGFTIEGGCTVRERRPGETSFAYLAEPADCKPVPKRQSRPKKGTAANSEI